MTPNDIFRAAASYLQQTVADSDDVAAFVPEWLNVLLAEALPTENALRRFDGQAELDAAPVVTAQTMDEALPYHEEILRTALPYGLAAECFREDESGNFEESDFRARYIAALGEALRTQGESIRDIY